MKISLNILALCGHSDARKIILSVSCFLQNLFIFVSMLRGDATNIGNYHTWCLRHIEAYPLPDRLFCFLSLTLFLLSFITIPERFYNTLFISILFFVLSWISRRRHAMANRFNFTFILNPKSICYVSTNVLSLYS